MALLDRIEGLSERLGARLGERFGDDGGAPSGDATFGQLLQGRGVNFDPFGGGGGLLRFDPFGGASGGMMRFDAFGGAGGQGFRFDPLGDAGMRFDPFDPGGRNVFGAGRGDALASIFAGGQQQIMRGRAATTEKEARQKKGQDAGLWDRAGNLLGGAKDRAGQAIGDAWETLTGAVPGQGFGNPSDEQIVRQVMGRGKPSPLAGNPGFITQMGQKYGVPVAMILAVLNQESGYGTDLEAEPVRQNNFMGLMAPDDPGLGGKRRYRSYGTWQEGVEDAVRNMATPIYHDLTLRQYLGLYLTGDPNGADDRAGNTTQSYIDNALAVIRNMGGNADPNSIVISKRQAAAKPAGGGGGGLQSVVGGGNAPIMQEFGPTEYSESRRDVGDTVYDYGAQYGHRGHTGVDIGVPANTRTTAPVGGTVVIAGGSGYYRDESGTRDPATSGELRLRLDNGDELIIGHMGRIDVKVGQRINAGDTVGVSGYANGDHLHVEARRRDPSTPSGWRIYDPREFLGGLPAGHHQGDGHHHE